MADSVRKVGVMDLLARTRTKLVVSENKSTRWRTGQQERSIKRGSDRECMAWQTGFHRKTQNRMSGSRALKFESQNSQF